MKEIKEYVNVKRNEIHSNKKIERVIKKYFAIILRIAKQFLLFVKISIKEKYINININIYYLYKYLYKYFISKNKYFNL